MTKTDIGKALFESGMTLGDVVAVIAAIESTLDTEAHKSSAFIERWGELNSQALEKLRG